MTDIEQLQAENERLRAEVDKRQALCEALTAALSSAEKSIERTRSLESARAERLAEALRTIACMSEYFGKELSDARRLAEKAVADLAQEDRND